MTEQYSIDLSGRLGRKGHMPADTDLRAASGKRLEQIYEVTTALMQSLDIREICEKMMDALFTSFRRIDAGGILAVGHNGDMEELVSRSRSKKKGGGIHYSRTVIDRVVQEAKAVMIANTEEQNEGNLSESIAIQRVKSLMCVPLIASAGVRGVIYLHSVDEPQAFQKEDLFFVTALSTPAALAVENALLYSRSKQAEEELQAAREDLEKLVQERTAELIKVNKQLQELSITDGLTGLYNHRHLIRTLESEYRRAVRYKRNFALLMIDVDYFKQVNDTYGHPCGDLVLQVIARLFKEWVRTTDVVARYGGDEIAIILLETNKEKALKVSEKLLQMVEKYPFEWEGHTFQVTVSIGVASVQEKPFEDWNGLLNAADKALYQAKEKARNTVVAFAAAEERMQLDLFTR